MGSALKAAAGVHTGAALRAAARVDVGRTLRLHTGGAAGVLKAAAGVRVGSALKAAAGVQTGAALRAAATVDMGRTLRLHTGGAAGVLKAAAGMRAGSALKAAAGVHTGAALRAAAGVDLGRTLRELAVPRLDPRLFGGVWDDRLASAIERLEHAETVIAAAPLPERAVEELATDADILIETAPLEARERVSSWVRWLWFLLAQKLFLDPLLDPAVEAARESVLEVLVALLVIAMPAAPALPPAPPLSASDGHGLATATPIPPGDWAVEGAPEIGQTTRAGRPGTAAKVP